MWVFLLAVAEAAPGCPASPADLSEALDAAEQAFRLLDAAGLEVNVREGAARVACLEGPIPPVIAARLHREEALLAFVRGDEAAARRALLAARALDPTGEPPLGLIPADHPLRSLDPGPPRGPLASVAVPAPPTGSVYFDGHPTLLRPADRPTAYQLLDGAGATRSGAYLLPEAPMPAYPALEPAPVVAAARPPSAASPQRARGRGPATVPLAIAGGLGLLTAGVGYTLAGVDHAEFYADGTSARRGRELVERSDTWMGLTWGGAGVGLACGLGAAATWLW